MSKSLMQALRLGNQLLNIVILALGLAAAYFMTIQSLKIELAAKAEAVVVETLDKKLGNLEIILDEGVVSRDEFYQFARSIEGRLTRIEFYVTETAGGEDGR